MKFKIGTVTYDAASIDMVTLKDILLLEKETGELGHPLRWSDVKLMAEEMAALKTDKQREDHPDSIWMLAITIWASRRVAGELLTFGDAVDFSMSDLTFIDDPQDHKAPARPTKARVGSARAANRPTAVA
jgi:hypothetical protein